jgi:hypothetical protein
MREEVFAHGFERFGDARPRYVTMEDGRKF